RTTAPASSSPTQARTRHPGTRLVRRAPAPPSGHRRSPPDRASSPAGSAQHSPDRATRPTPTHSSQLGDVFEELEAAVEGAGAHQIELQIRQALEDRLTAGLAENQREDHHAEAVHHA